MRISTAVEQSRRLVELYPYEPISPHVILRAQAPAIVAMERPSGCRWPDDARASCRLRRTEPPHFHKLIIAGPARAGMEPGLRLWAVRTDL